MAMTSAPPRALITAAAAELLHDLQRRHGPVMFHQSGGCCDGSSPMCYPDGEFIVGDRDVLLRLQNNIKLRRLQAGLVAAGLETLEHMLIFAPDRPELWWEAAALHAGQGNLRAAILAAQQVGALSDDPEARYRAAQLVQQLQARLN